MEPNIFDAFVLAALAACILSLAVIELLPCQGSKKPKTATTSAKATATTGLIAKSLAHVIATHPELIIQHKEALKGDMDTLTFPPGIKTLADIMPTMTRCYGARKCFGYRPIISYENVADENGRINEKLRLGDYVWFDHFEVESKVKDVAGGLKSMGIVEGDRVCIHMSTSMEWHMVFHAAITIGAIVTTVYPTLGEDAFVSALNETGAKVVFTEASLLAVVKKVAGRANQITAVIYSGENEAGDWSSDFNGRVSLVALCDVEAKGKQNHVLPSANQNPDSVALVMFTSGSTGQPKGVIFSHTNILSAVAGMEFSVPPMDMENDIGYAYLPLAHILALVGEMYTMLRGVPIGYGSPTTITTGSPRLAAGTEGDLSVLNPTHFAVVPMVAERIRRGIQSKISQKGYLAQAVFWAAYKAKENAWASGNPVTPWLDAIIFDKVKHTLGGRVKYLLSGGAPLNPSTQKFLSVSLGIPVVQGYGLTETCACGTLVPPTNIETPRSLGVVGFPVGATKIKLCDWDEGGYCNSDSEKDGVRVPRGEIVVGGPSVALGYWGRNEKENEDGGFYTDADGNRWYRTGDIGAVDAMGRVMIVDRRKDLVKLQQGEYLSLGKIESVLLSDPHVAQVMVHADPTRNYCTALVVPNAPALLQSCKTIGLYTNRPWAQVCSDSSVREIVRASLVETGRKATLAKFEIPASVWVCGEMWTPESGLVTGSMKVRRNAICERYGDVIGRMYGESVW